MTTHQVRIIVYQDGTNVITRLLDNLHSSRYHKICHSSRVDANTALETIKQLIQSNNGFDIPDEVSDILKKVFGADAPKMGRDLGDFMEQYQFSVQRVVKRCTEIGWERLESRPSKAVEGVAVGEMCRELAVGAWIEMVKRHWALH